MRVMKEQTVEFAFKFCPRCSAKNPRLGTAPFRCTDCGFVHFFGPVAAVGGLLVNAQGQLLLVRRARDPGKGKWGLPGGFVDQGESIEAALRREIDEETNLRVDNFVYLMSSPNQYNYRGITAPVIDVFYRCRVEAPELLSLAPDELDHHEWVRPTSEHLENMAFRSNRIAIERWLAS